MADNISKYNRKHKAELALASAELALAEARLALEKLDRPKSPGDGQYKIDVRFDQFGAKYTFLMLIHKGTVYTTAVKDGGQFRTFDQFIEWLENKKPYFASDIIKLGDGATAVQVSL